MCKMFNNKMSHLHHIQYHKRLTNPVFAGSTWKCLKVVQGNRDRILDQQGWAKLFTDQLTGISPSLHGQLS